MESIPEISLIDLSIPQQLCKELLQLYAKKGGILSSIEVKSPDSSSVVKIIPSNDEVIIKVSEPHYLFKKSSRRSDTPSQDNVKFEAPIEEDCAKYQLKCLIPFQRYHIAEQTGSKEGYQTRLRERTVTETSGGHSVSNESISDSERDSQSEPLLEPVEIKEELDDANAMVIDDGDTTDDDQTVIANDEEEEAPERDVQEKQTDQRVKHPRKRGRPRKVVPATLPPKSITKSTIKSKLHKQRQKHIKKLSSSAASKLGRKKKGEETVKRKRRRKVARRTELTDDEEDPTGAEHAEVHKPKIGRPKKNLEYRNLSTLNLECKYCGEQYTGVAELVNHVSIKHSDKEDYKTFIAGCVGMPFENLFVCEMCGVVFRQVYMLRRHLRLEHKDNPKFEAYMIKLGGKLMPNSMQQLEENAIKCKFCSMSSMQGFDVYEHTKVKHINEADYEAAQEELRQKIKVKCTLCEKTFINPKYIYTHMKLTHCNETHVCDICGHVFKNKYLLRGHVRSVHDSDKVKLMCDRCPSTFATINKLQLHIRMVHEKVGRVQCPECGKILSTDKALKCHVEAVHQRLRPNMCEYCGKEFYSGKDLRAHVKVVHEYVDKNYWPHECHVCSRKFADKRNMNKHIQQVHNKVFPFTCQICSKGFPQGKGFRDHVTKHHPQLACKVQKDVKMKTITTSDLEEAMMTGGGASPSNERHQQDHHSSQLRFDQSPFPMLQSAISEQESSLQQQQVTAAGPSTSVTNNVPMTTSAVQNSQQLMSFEGIHLGGRPIPIENRGLPFDNRNMHMDDQAVHLNNRVVQMDTRNHHLDSNNIPLNRNPHVDNRGMHMNNRAVHMDGRNIPIDTRNIHMDTRNIPLDTRNIHLDSRNVHLDNRNIHLDNRNNAIGNYYQY